MQDKLAGDAKNKQIREIYKDLVDECLARPPSAEDANSIAGELSYPWPSYLPIPDVRESSDRAGLCRTLAPFLLCKGPS